MKNFKKLRFILLILFLIIILIGFIWNIISKEDINGQITKDYFIEEEINDREKMTKNFLNEENSYTSNNITRMGDSGPGTGRIFSKGREFAFGNCSIVHNDDDWMFETPGCSSKILKKEICVREKNHPEMNFTVYFLSWTVGPDNQNQRCLGECEENDDTTAFLVY
jgi:hypothetical protein